MNDKTLSTKYTAINHRVRLVVLVLMWRRQQPALNGGDTRAGRELKEQCLTAHLHLVLVCRRTDNGRNIRRFVSDIKRPIPAPRVAETCVRRERSRTDAARRSKRPNSERYFDLTDATMTPRGFVCPPACTRVRPPACTRVRPPARRRVHPAARTRVLPTIARAA